MSESNIVDKFIYSQLAASGITSYKGIADPDATYPVVTYQQQSPRDINSGSGYRIMVEFIYLVRVVGKESFSKLDSIVDSIDGVLHDKHDISIDDGGILSCLRIRPFEMEEFDNAAETKYYHRGAYYRIRVKRG